MKRLVDAIRVALLDSSPKAGDGRGECRLDVEAPSSREKLGGCLASVALLKLSKGCYAGEAVKEIGTSCKSKFMCR